MNHTEASERGAEAHASSQGPSRHEFLGEEKRAAERLVDDAKAAASSAGAHAKDAAADKAEEIQGIAASHLRNFADAVRVAGDDLAQKEPGPISDIVRQAAQGLEHFSNSLERQSPAEMIDGIRDFGRQNPVGFLAGAMLAGFSLARFAGSGAPSGSERAPAREFSSTGFGEAPQAGSQRSDEPGEMTGGVPSAEFSAGPEDVSMSTTPETPSTATYDRARMGAPS